MTAVTYPRLIKRVRAVLIDSVLLPVCVFSVLLHGDSFGVSSVYGKAMLIFLPIFLLEPGMVAFTGGTVGHHLLKIRVAKRDGSRNINIFAATIRFAVKLVLGWLSFIFVLTTTKHQAVHDFVAGSIVIHKDATGLPAYDILSERTRETDAYVYPAAWRRVAVITVYWFLCTIALVIGSYIAITADCMRGRNCTSIDQLANIALAVAWLVSLGWVTVRGWSGRLVGCRRRLRDA
jgi:uncharacterized RDD family membrane protein YckC